MDEQPTDNQVIPSADLLKDLADVRVAIDAIDVQLLNLLNERAKCAEQVAVIKSRDASVAGPVFYRPERCLLYTSPSPRDRG